MPDRAGKTPGFYSRREAAAFLEMGPTKFDQWRKAGVVPAPAIEDGKHKRWTRAQLDSVPARLVQARADGRLAQPVARGPRAAASAAETIRQAAGEAIAEGRLTRAEARKWRK